jgi:hypothetical protein
MRALHRLDEMCERGCCVSESITTRAREGRDAARRFCAQRGCLLEGRGADSAYTHRQAPFILDINTRWDDGDSERHIEWTRAFWEAMRPFSAGGVYVNFPASRERVACSKPSGPRSSNASSPSSAHTT